MQIYPAQVITSLDSIRTQAYQFRDFIDDLGNELAKSEPDEVRDKTVLKDPRYCPALFLAINEINLEIKNLQRRGYKYPDHLLDESDQRLLEIVDNFPILGSDDLQRLVETLPTTSLRGIAELDPKDLNDSSNRILIQHLNSKYPGVFGFFEELTNSA